MLGQNAPRLILFLSFTLGLLLNSLTLIDGHNWGGDFAQYLLNAQNILQGKPYNNGIMVAQVISYPPGFPLMLAGIMKFTGLHFLYLKWINILGWYLSLALIWLLLKRRYPPLTSSLIVSLFCFSSFYFMFKQNILSDIPFFLCTLAGMYAFDRYLENPKKSLAWLIRAVIFMALALTLRSMGIVLILSAVYFCSAIKKDLKAVGFLMLSCGATLVLCQLISQTHQPGMFHNFLSRPLDTVVTIARHSPLVWQSITWFFVHGTTSMTVPLFRAVEAIMIILSPLVYLTLVWFFIRKSMQKTLTFIECSVIIYLMALLLWTYFNDSPDNFTRYVLPVCPLILMIMQPVLSQVKQGVLNSAFIVLILINAANIMTLRHFNDDEILHFKPNQEVFAWMSSHVTTGHYMIWEPRTTALMTGKVGSTLGWLKFNPPSLWPSIFKAQDIHYIILNKVGDQEFIHIFQNTFHLSPLWENALYQIYKTQTS